MCTAFTFSPRTQLSPLFCSRQQDSSDSARDSGSQSQFPFSQLDDSQLTQDLSSQHSGDVSGQFKAARLKAEEWPDVVIHVPLLWTPPLLGAPQAIQG